MLIEYSEHVQMPIADFTPLRPLPPFTLQLEAEQMYMFKHTVSRARAHIHAAECTVTDSQQVDVSQQKCTWMNSLVAPRHMGHGWPFSASAAAQSPHANRWPQGKARCDLVPMKQIEHVVPPPNVDVSSTACP